MCISVICCICTCIPCTSGTSPARMLVQQKSKINHLYYHSDWEQRIPALLHAYHNTVHSATGFTPHRLLFGWCPRDLRAPLAAGIDTPHGDVERWLRERADELQKAHVSIEHSRASMIRARKASERAHVYRPGDLVKVSAKVLDVVSASTQTAKLQPKYVGPFPVVSAGEHGTVVLDLPNVYSRVHNVFNVCDIRPWLHDGSGEVDVTYPALRAQPSYNHVVQVLDRKRAPGRTPAQLHSLLGIPAEYLIVRHDRTVEWLHQSRLQEPAERELLKKFERRFKRTEELKCAPVRRYGAEAVAEEEDNNEDSDDEVDVLWESQLYEHFGPLSH